MRDATIRVFRPEVVRDPDRGAVYRLSIDGEVVGDLWSGQAVLHMVESGEHRIQILANQTVSWFTSNEVIVQSDRSNPVALVCKLRGGLPALNLLFRRKNYLVLEALSPEASLEMERTIKSGLERMVPPPRDLGALLKEGKDLRSIL